MKQGESSHFIFQVSSHYSFNVICRSIQGIQDNLKSHNFVKSSLSCVIYLLRPNNDPVVFKHYLDLKEMLKNRCMRNIYLYTVQFIYSIYLALFSSWFCFHKHCLIPNSVPSRRLFFEVWVQVPIYIWMCAQSIFI